MAGEPRFPHRRGPREIADFVGWGPPPSAQRLGGQENNSFGPGDPGLRATHEFFHS